MPDQFDQSLYLCPHAQEPRIIPPSLKSLLSKAAAAVSDPLLPVLNEQQQQTRVFFIPTTAATLGGGAGAGGGGDKHSPGDNKLVTVSCWY